MRFRVLGPLEVIGPEGDRTPSAPKVREVLALLLLHQGHIVRSRTLIDELWGENPPPSALATLQTYIYKLRKVLAADPSNETLRTKAYGYVMTVSPEDLDHCRFERLLEEGQAAFDGGEPERASRILGQALALWRGPALADVDTGPILSAEVTRLEERRLRALEVRIDADLQLGRHQELISELKTLTTAHPLHEVFHAKLMLALQGAGRRYEALDVYRRLRDTLVENLGLEPSASLVKLHQSLLSSDWTPEPPMRRTAVMTAPREHQPAEPDAAARSLPPGERRPREESRPEPQAPHAGGVSSLTRVPPAQLPPDIEDFTGREDILDRLSRHLLAEDDRDSVRVASIVGMAGVGKTALAVRLAHRISRHFPDGQLYADLGGMTDRPASPADVLQQFLRAAGFPAEEIPASVDERAKQFRTWAAGRRLLVVLDDAVSSAEVTRLLPGSPGCAVIVTGRGHGLPSSCTVALDVLSFEQAMELLGRIVGQWRVQMERATAARIVTMCGMLPLALRVAGMRLAARPSWPLEKFAEELADPTTRLNALRIGDLDLRAAYDATYRRIGDREKSIFQLLALLPTGAFSADQAATLLGCDRAAAEAVLGRLVESHLLRVVRQTPDGPLYYEFPELSRIYARERLEQLISGHSTGPSAGPGPYRPQVPAAGPDGRGRNGVAPHPVIPLSPVLDRPRPLVSVERCDGEPERSRERQATPVAARPQG
ncbi:AfsR/SARP family transcriptional regulator [Thermomonospora cellulosilytica]|uniref:DNA-binding SARP family transcriptional activator n=1 Tax=Thermomonospora cellulosilytica TaxID=1411118 RepID=A0A7W3N146_9ACTN|nr:AfsR/SARP family transcriptional regulator [Thermomonospora cellulosilytica]MBA9005542.1 DNA-binding SARP family transcriptional activator [Thermomonospora cellulosilytica]